MIRALARLVDLREGESRPAWRAFLLLALVIVSVNLIVDLAVGVIDPRIRAGT